MGSIPCPGRGLELWGGIECTVNRIGDTYLDQIELSGHVRRPEDLDMLADLGLRALRYPLLWERLHPEPTAAIDWQWADERLGRLRSLEIQPIVGLVHHGSGPRHTNLLDPSFAPGLARFGRAVAMRYPWVESYTPVNEPLTTARFSALYGHWYPHRRDAAAFWRALLGQCRAVVLTMDAIRTINPAAQLVQTEDLGKIYSTPALAYQADFENERRWITWDLLSGQVNRCHPLWSYFLWTGLDESELTWFLDHPCPPDILGINYYVTSERFLDHRLERYPSATHGGNGRSHYADVEAVRVRAKGLTGLGPLLAETWQRFRRPLAVTEVHLGCTREEQMRWFWEAWQAARQQWQAGVDVRAVTAWALLGSYDWDSLVTRPAGHYEPAAFDLRAPRPRPTGLATLIREVGAGGTPSHPVLASPGWWRRATRLLDPAAFPARSDGGGTSRSRPILITGATGALGQAFGRHCRGRGIAYRLFARRDLDIAQPISVDRAIAQCQPWAVINAAEYDSVDNAERQPDRCRRENTRGPIVLARACARHGVAFLTFSSAMVFDGRQNTPYRESDPVKPLNVYGQSKAAAERAVLTCLPAALVVRSGVLFDSCDEGNFVLRMLRVLATGRMLRVSDDVVISPTYVPHLVDACLDLLVDGTQGVWHLANQGGTTWADLARQCATLAGLDPAQVVGGAAATAGAGRPRYSVLGSERGNLLPCLTDALGCYFQAQPFHESVAMEVAPWTASKTEAEDLLNHHVGRRRSFRGSV